MAAFARRGLVVQPFKVGPDFIDPSHHTRICGRVSRNLDPVMMGEDEILRTFVNACTGADIAIIEGVMGMYDGIDGTTFGSSAHVARLLKTPVILVISVKGMSGSVHAIAEGFKNHEPGSQLQGVILNRVGSPRHRLLLRKGESVTQLGYIPVSDELVISSRHLGLHMAEEAPVSPDIVQIIEENCDIPALLSLSTHALPLPRSAADRNQDSVGIRVAVGFDSAFCFYYQENLDRLIRAGAEIVFFSPIADPLPDADLLYLGGGYPELFAKELETGSAKNAIRKAGDDGMPVYAECGGLMYLGRGLAPGAVSQPAAWVDLLPCDAEMKQRFQALGYTRGIFSSGPSIASPGTEIRGHEFHYSSLNPDSDARYAITLTRGIGIAGGKDGIFVHNSMGSYTHAYFSEKNISDLVKAADIYRRR
jgi:cobyrinic acid a,c-diamide synthase